MGFVFLIWIELETINRESIQLFVFSDSDLWVLIIF